MRARQQKDLDLDTWLEAGLRAGLDRLVTDTVPVSRYAVLSSPAPRRGARRRILAGSASAVMLMGGSAVAVAAASTGTLDTAVWGRHINAAVKMCRSELPAGESGIGRCVSAIASRKGEHGDHAGEGADDRGAKNAHSKAKGSRFEHGATPPGQGGTSPGQDGTPADHGGTPPGQGGAPHGHGAAGHSPKN